MPKVKETKKPEPVKASTITPVASEPQKVVFRAFECLMRLEEALAQLKKVGIFPGPEGEAIRLKAKVETAITQTESAYKDYLALWGGMQKS